MEHHEHHQQPDPYRPTDSAEGSGQPTPESRPGPKRLYRSSDQKMLLGVAGGLAEYFEVDPTLIRIGFILLTLLGGGGLLLYVVLAVIMPSEETLDAHPREAARSTVDEAVSETRRAAERAGTWIREKTGRSSSRNDDVGSTPPSSGP